MEVRGKNPPTLFNPEPTATAYMALRRFHWFRALASTGSDSERYCPPSPLTPS